MVEAEAKRAVVAAANAKKQGDDNTGWGRGALEAASDKGRARAKTKAKTRAIGWERRRRTSAGPSK